MTDFNELQQTYLQEGPQTVFTKVDALTARERYDLLIANAHQRKRTRKVESEKAEELPDAYRKVKTRWEMFDYLLGNIDGKALEQHMEPHITYDEEGGTYLRNALALLVWKSTDETRAVTA